MPSEASNTAQREYALSGNDPDSRELSSHAQGRWVGSGRPMSFSGMGTGSGDAQGPAHSYAFSREDYDQASSRRFAGSRLTSNARGRGRGAS
eukprot:1324064-Amorphochlora_amoeboformis.AAC.2